MCMLEKGVDGSRRLKLDLAIGHSNPCAIAEGLDSATNAEDLDTAEFPITLLLRGLDINIAQAQASQQADKRRILNSICDVTPSMLDAVEPRTDHRNYSKVCAIPEGRAYMLMHVQVNEDLGGLLAETAMKMDMCIDSLIPGHALVINLLSICFV